MKKIVAVGLVGVAAMLGLTAWASTQEPDIRWYVNRPHYEAPVELEDSPQAVPVFEIRTGWLCDAGHVVREPSGRESRVVQCEKDGDRVDFALVCGAGHSSDSQQLRFSKLSDSHPIGPQDALTVGCIAR